MPSRGLHGGNGSVQLRFIEPSCFTALISHFYSLLWRRLQQRYSGCVSTPGNGTVLWGPGWGGVGGQGDQGDEGWVGRPATHKFPSNTLVHDNSKGGQRIQCISVTQSLKSQCCQMLFYSHNTSALPIEMSPYIICIHNRCIWLSKGLVGAAARGKGQVPPSGSLSRPGLPPLRLPTTSTKEQLRLPRFSPT